MLGDPYKKYGICKSCKFEYLNHFDIFCILFVIMLYLHVYSNSSLSPFVALSLSPPSGPFVNIFILYSPTLS